MILLLSFLSIVRINYPTGEINYIPKLKFDQIRSFVNEKSLVVLFFTNNPDECSFANFAITHFAKYIKFALAPESEGNLYQCKSYPCIVPFSNGKPMQIVRPAPRQKTLFGHWCAENLSPTKIEITDVEYLRSILNTNNGFFVIAIDTYERTSNIPSEIPFYCCSSKLFHKLSIQNVSKGIYVYRGSDHLLNLVENDNFLELISSKITPYEEINPSNKKFTAGFNFDTKDQSKSEYKINLLLNLSKTFSDNFYFTRFDNDIIFESKLQFVKEPLFVVFNNSQPQFTNNWILTGKEAFNYDTIVNFLSNINRNALSYTHHSQSTKDSIEIDRFNELVLGSNENDTLLIIADDYSKYIELKTVVEAVLTHLNSKTIDCFTLNATINDMPIMVNPKKLPALLIFRGGKDKGEKPPVFFHGEFLFQEIIGFVQQTAASKLQVSQYNLRQKEELIREMRKKHKI